MEYAVEAAALFNPSMVAHPDQSGLGPGELRFVMSVRAVGEGHLSSVEFHTGVLRSDAGLTVDDPGTTLVTGTRRASPYDRVFFAARLAELGADQETVGLVLGVLPARFTADQLQDAVAALHPHLHDRRAGHEAIDQINRVAAGEYAVTFPADTSIGERLLWPNAPTEVRGMEDVRLVRFTEDSGQITYHGTYTAYDGSRVAPQLLTTGDFTTFSIGQLAGPAARDKGLALFPRRFEGRYLALSRWDRESITLGVSDDLRGECGVTPAGCTRHPQAGS